MLEKRIHLGFNNNYNPVFLFLTLFWFKANVVVESIPLIPSVGVGVNPETPGIKPPYMKYNRCIQNPLYPHLLLPT